MYNKTKAIRDLNIIRKEAKAEFINEVDSVHDFGKRLVSACKSEDEILKVMGFITGKPHVSCECCEIDFDDLVNDQEV